MATSGPSGSGGPVGTGDYTVRQGDCIESIAAEHGLRWQTVWNAPENAELRQARKDPNVLMPGDRITVPSPRGKTEQGATDQRHRFCRNGVPSKLKVQLLCSDEPRADEAYSICIDGRWRDGVTDGDGFVEESIPPHAQQVRLVVGQGPPQDVYQLGLGTVDPMDTEEGVRKRLVDLGYDAHEDLGAAITAFQHKEKLEESGEMDEATRARLKERFGL